MAKKVIGSKEILSKYQKSKLQLESSKDSLVKKCDRKLIELERLTKHEKNKEDERRLNEAMGRIVKFKNELFLAWRKNLNSDFLDTE